MSQENASSTIPSQSLPLQSLVHPLNDLHVGRSLATLPFPRDTAWATSQLAPLDRNRVADEPAPMMLATPRGP